MVSKLQYYAVTMVMNNSSKEFDDFLIKNGISRELTVLRTPFMFLDPSVTQKLYF